MRSQDAQRGNGRLHLKRGGMAVMLHFMYQLDAVTGYPGILLNIISEHVCESGDETNI